MLDGFPRLSISNPEQMANNDSPVVVQDITGEYFAACHQSLSIGELIHSEGFTLQDSISALEIMDPKMDNGVIDPSIEDVHAYDCSRGLVPDEIMAIIDQLLASEVTWYNGSSLSQTLYTCVYLQKLLGKSLSETGFSNDSTKTQPAKELLDKVLFPYVVATIKSADICRDEYLVGYLYEEEDVSSADFGLELLPFTQPQTAVELLLEGLQWLEHMPPDHALLISSSQIQQMCKRLKFRLTFLELLRTLNHPEQHARLVQDFLLHTEGYEVVDKPVEEFPEIFNTNIQRTLISTSPPRPIISMLPKDALSEITRTCKDLVRILPVISDARTSPSSMLEFFEVIRKSRPATLPLVRSRMQSLFLKDKMAEHAVNKQRFIIAAIEEVTGRRPELFDEKLAQVESPNDRRFRINRLVSGMLTRLEPPFFDLFKVLCHNPGRQRRNLCKILIDFDILQAEAEVVDQDLAVLVNEKPKRLANGHTSLAFTISSWIFSIKLDICQSILFMGQETELYKPIEWSMIYWHIDNFLFLQNEHLYSIAIDRLPTSSPIRAHLSHRLLYNEALALLCKATSKLMHALELLNVISTPQLKFSSPEILYNHRMAPFSKLISPPPVSYAMYLAEQSQGTSRSAFDALKDAGDFFSAARSKLGTLSKRGASARFSSVPALVEDFKSEMRALVGCCIANNLTISKLLKHDVNWFSAPERKLVMQDNQFSRRFPCVTVI